MLNRLLASAGFARWLQLLSLQGVLGSQHLLRQMLGRSLQSAYTGAAGGWIWIYFRPLVMVVAYYFVFGKILAVRMDAAVTGTGSYPLYLISGLIPWMIFLDGVMSGSSSLVREAGLLKKARFPLELIPAREVLLAAVRFAPLLLLIWPLGIWLADGHPLGLLPVLAWLLLQLLFTYFLVLVLCLMSAALRDIGMLVESVFPLLLFFAPILYPRDRVPADFSWLLSLNPFTPLVNGYHDLLLGGRLPSWPDLGLLCAWLLIFGWAAHLLLRRSREQVVDWL